MDLFLSSIFIPAIIHTKFTIIPLRLKSQKLLETFQYYAIRESGYFLYYFTWCQTTERYFLIFEYFVVLTNLRCSFQWCWLFFFIKKLIKIPTKCILIFFTIAMRRLLEGYIKLGKVCRLTRVKVHFIN